LFNRNGNVLIQCPAGRTGSYMIPNSVTNIGDRAFEGCGLVSVTIPNTVTNIGDSAFDTCTNLTNVTIPYSVKSIGSEVFEYCTKLASVVIPNSVTNIGWAAFRQCASLTSVTIPNSVESIGGSAFEACYGLTNVTIGNGVTGIGDAAFGGCSSLISVTIPNSVNNIHPYAFAGCTGLIRVTIGNGVNRISDRAFGCCTNLEGIYFKGNAPALGLSVFDSDEYATVYYLSGTTGWVSTFGGLPTAVWRPEVISGDGSFGVQTNQFGFEISWASDKAVVVEACTNLASPVWSPVATNILTGGSSYFCDPQWTNYPACFYRVRSL
jgi:hypothetical protein